MGGGDGEFTQGLGAPRPIDESSSMRSLFPLVYRELKAVARRQLGRAPGHSFDTTGLVHEVYFKLADMDRSVVKDRSHFLAISARAMRQVLVAAARKRHRAKRGSGIRPSTF
ncbi:MAG: ECF-type sigma factor, partial [Acidobacteriota bacterium]